MLLTRATPPERRGALRFPMFRPVDFAFGGRVHKGLTHDLSTCGMRLLSAFRLPRGTELVVTLPEGALSVRQKPLALLGRVVWSDENAAGIAFSDATSPASECLTRYFEDYLEHADAREIATYLRRRLPLLRGDDAAEEAPPDA